MNGPPVNARFSHAVLMDIDGCRKDLLYEMMDSGELPNLNRVFSSGCRFHKAEGVFPSITFPSQASIITGRFPRNHGILNNVWMDRRDPEKRMFDYTDNKLQALAVYRYSLFGLPTLFLPSNLKMGLADGHINGRTRTLYETLNDKGLTSLVGFHQFARGASHWVRPTPWDMARYFGSRFVRSQFDVFDDHMMKGIYKTIDKQGLPNLTFIYFAPCDGSGHLWGMDGQKWYLKNLVDKRIGELIKKIKSEGIHPEEVLFVLFADHGQTDVICDREHVVLIEELIEAVREIPGFNRVGFSQPVLPLDALVLRGGGMVGIYIKNQSTKQWRDDPSPEQMLAVAKKLLEKMKDKISSIIYKNPQKECYSDLIRDFNHNIKSCLGKGKDEGDNQFISPHILDKINRQYYHPLTPDLLLFSNYDRGFYFYFLPVMSIHGNITEEDFSIPLIFSGGDIKWEERQDPASIVDVIPTVAHLLGLTHQPADGNKLEIRS